MKAGVPHVEAPTDLLASMLTARLHLDAMTLENGPLLVIPGSHQKLDAPSRDPVQLQCEAGDVMLMRPLLSHSSIASSPDCMQHRRIVHLEFAPEPELSDGYKWQDFVPIG